MARGGGRSLLSGAGLRARVKGTRGPGWARRVVSLILVVVPTVALAASSQSASAAAARSSGPDGRLRTVHCGPLPGDPPIQAPSYAQQRGASSESDGWWCELPHVTALPGGFVALKRYVGTLPGTYADYITQFAPKGTTPTTATSGRVLTLVAEAESGVFLPKHLHYPRSGGRRAVRLAGGVRATLSASKSLVGVSWRFSTRGAPAYLSGVVSVSITGHDVPEKTVVAVARRIRPL